MRLPSSTVLPASVAVDASSSEKTEALIVDCGKGHFFCWLVNFTFYMYLFRISGFQDSPTNWDKHFDELMDRAVNSSKIHMHILRVCESNGYSIFDLPYLFKNFGYKS